MQRYNSVEYGLVFRQVENLCFGEDSQDVRDAIGIDNHAADHGRFAFPAP
jgi:hypothetical protein